MWLGDQIEHSTQWNENSIPFNKWALSVLLCEVSKFYCEIRVCSKKSIFFFFSSPHVAALSLCVSAPKERFAPTDTSRTRLPTTSKMIHTTAEINKSTRRRRWRLSTRTTSRRCMRFRPTRHSPWMVAAPWCRVTLKRQQEILIRPHHSTTRCSSERSVIPRVI